MSKSNSISLFLVCCILGLSACRTADKKTVNKGNNVAKLESYFNYKIKYADSLAKSEILLELVIKNNSNAGVMIKWPFMQIVDMQRGDTTSFAELLNITDFSKIRTEKAYEGSIADSSKNPLRFALERYIIDSLRRANIEPDSLINSDMYGYSFIHPNENHVFLLDLTKKT